MIAITSAFRKLSSAGVLGINQRNADFILKYNNRRFYPLVDDKVITKQLAIQHGIQVPELYQVIEIQHQVKEAEMFLRQHNEFVIKPAHGSGGNGILVIRGKVGKYYRKANGDLLTSENLQHYVSNILSGMYSLSGISDKAIVEYCVNFDPFFKDITYQGVPDIRVIVFRGIPVAAMLRLPTRESDGKANLHQGAMGIGIDIGSGGSRKGVLHDTITTLHPDTGYDTSQITIPKWNEILKVSMQCADMVGLQYLGVDIVLDQELGPLMLELNARPGLNIQLANQEGLLKKLQRIESYQNIPDSLTERQELAAAL